jgi:hypothetical protein
MSVFLSITGHSQPPLFENPYKYNNIVARLRNVLTSSAYPNTLINISLEGCDFFFVKFLSPVTLTPAYVSV